MSNILVDTSGNGNNGTIVGAVSSKDGMVFNSKDKYVLLDSTINLKEEATICMKGIRSSETGSYLLSNASGGTRTLHWSNQTLKFYNKSGTEDETLITTSDIVAGTSFDLVVSINGTIANTYVNGVFIQTATFTSSLDAEVREIGTSIFLNRGAFDELADLQIHNRAWTEQEAKDYHNSFQKTVIGEAFDDYGVGQDGDSLSGTHVQVTSGAFTIQELATQSGDVSQLDIGTKYILCGTGGAFKIRYNGSTSVDAIIDYYDGANWSRKEDTLATLITGNAWLTNVGEYLIFTLTAGDGIATDLIKNLIRQ